MHKFVSGILVLQSFLKEAGCFAIIVLQMYCYYKCSVALPHGAMGWSAVCGCGIFDHTLALTILQDRRSGGPENSAWTTTVSPDQHYMGEKDKNRAIVALNRSPVLCAPVLFSGR